MQEEWEASVGSKGVITVERKVVAYISARCITRDDSSRVRAVKCASSVYYIYLYLKGLNSEFYPLVNGLLNDYARTMVNFMMYNRGEVARHIKDVDLYLNRKDKYLVDLILSWVKHPEITAHILYSADGSSESLYDVINSCKSNGWLDVSSEELAEAHQDAINIMKLREVLKGENQ